MSSALMPAYGQEPSSPIERLKNRSAEQRWTELKESMQRPRRRPGQAPPRSTAMPAPPASRSANLAEPATIAETAQSPATSNVAADSEPRGSEALSTPAPATVGRTSGLRPAPDSLANSDSANVAEGNELESVPSQIGVADGGSARPFPVMAQRRDQDVAEPSLRDDGRPVTVPLESVHFSPGAAPVPIPLEQVFRPEGDATPLLVPNPAAYQVAAETLGRAELETSSEMPSGAGGVISNRQQLPDVPRAVVPDASQFLPPMPSAGGPLRTAQVDTAPATDVISPQEQPSVDLYEFRAIGQINPFQDYSPNGRTPSANSDDPRSRSPKVVQLEEQGSVERAFATTEFQWEATNVFHNPLYFEDVELERYGHTYHPVIQPAASLAKFGVQAAGLPYQIALNPVWKQQYPLGYYRPGDPAPPLFYQIPFNSRAAITSAGVYTGMFFIFP